MARVLKAAMPRLSLVTINGADRDTTSPIIWG
jgi:hypothetical protein